MRVLTTGQMQLCVVLQRLIRHLNLCNIKARPLWRAADANRWCTSANYKQGHSFKDECWNTSKSTGSDLPVWLEHKVHCPWLLFRATTMLRCMWQTHQYLRNGSHQLITVDQCISVLTRGIRNIYQNAHHLHGKSCNKTSSLWRRE